MAFPRATLFLTLGCLLFAGTCTHGQSLLTNGDFEIINVGTEPKQTFPSWTENISAGGVDAVTPLFGSHSLKLLGSGLVTISQDLAVSLTDPFVFSLTFAMNDPGSGNRGLNFYLIGPANVGGTQVNLRAIQAAGVASLLDIQVYDGAGWQTILTDVVSLSSNLDTAPVNNSLSLSGQFNGASSSYSVTVNESTSATVSHFQSGKPTSLSGVRLLTANGTSGADWVVDNISLVPEPSTIAILIGGIATLCGLRRRRA